MARIGEEIAAPALVKVTGPGTDGGPSIYEYGRAEAFFSGGGIEISYYRVRFHDSASGFFPTTSLEFVLRPPPKDRSVAAIDNWLDS